MAVLGRKFCRQRKPETEKVRPVTCLNLVTRQANCYRAFCYAEDPAAILPSYTPCPPTIIARLCISNIPPDPDIWYNRIRNRIFGHAADKINSISQRIKDWILTRLPNEHHSLFHSSDDSQSWFSWPSCCHDAFLFFNSHITHFHISPFKYIGGWQDDIENMY